MVLAALHPSRTTVFRKLNLTLAGLWVVLYAVILLRWPEPGLIAIGLSPKTGGG